MEHGAWSTPEKYPTVPMAKLLGNITAYFLVPFPSDSVVKMGKHGQSTYGQRKGLGDAYHNSRDISPYLHSNQKIPSASCHFGDQPKYDRPENSNGIQPKITCSDFSRQSRRYSYRTSVPNGRNHTGGSPDTVYGPPTPIPSRYKDIRDHRYDRTIREIFCQSLVLKQTLQKLLDTLAWLQSDPDEMEWESSNPTYLVGALPNRDENNHKKAESSTAVVPSFMDALSSGGEKMENQRQHQNGLEREMNEPFILHPDFPLACNNHAKPQSR